MKNKFTWLIVLSFACASTVLADTDDVSIEAYEWAAGCGPVDVELRVVSGDSANWYQVRVYGNATGSSEGNAACSSSSSCSEDIECSVSLDSELIVPPEASVGVAGSLPGPGECNASCTVCQNDESDCEGESPFCAEFASANGLIVASSEDGSEWTVIDPPVVAEVTTINACQ